MINYDLNDPHFEIIQLNREVCGDRPKVMGDETNTIIIKWLNKQRIAQELLIFKKTNK